jgi:hypothetical protein
MQRKELKVGDPIIDDNWNIISAEQHHVDEFDNHQDVEYLHKTLQRALKQPLKSLVNKGHQ